MEEAMWLWLITICRVAAYKDSGVAIKALELLLPLFPFWTRFYV